MLNFQKSFKALRNRKSCEVYESFYVAAPQQGQSIQAWIFVIPVGGPNDTLCVDVVVALDQIVGYRWYEYKLAQPELALNSTTRRLNGEGKTRMSLAVLGSVMSIDAPSGIST